MQKAFREIHRNGFFDPVVEYGANGKRLRWRQMVEQIHDPDNAINRQWTPIRATLCTLCKRKICRGKASEKPEDTGFNPCWKSNAAYMRKLRHADRLTGI
jgi:hypothetical protein